MAIQMRRGANSDFSPSKMLPGEIAVTTDGTRKVYAAFQANDVKELASKEDVQGLINGFTSVVDREIAEAEQRIESKAETVLGTIPDDYETLSQKADEAVRTKADAIVCTVSGVNPIAKDSSNDYLRNLKLYGKTTQATTSGKQLIPEWTRGILSVDDGEEVITNAYWVHTEEYVEIDENTQYTTSADSICYFTVYRYDENKNFIDILQLLRESTSSLYTNSSEVKYVRFGYNYNGMAEEITPDKMGVTHWVQFELGTVATDFEEYTGKQPSPNPSYPQPLESVGKWGNLAHFADTDAFTHAGVTWSCKNGAITAKGTANTSYPSTTGDGSRLICDITGKKGTFFASGSKDNVLITVVKTNASGTTYYTDKSFTLDGTETKVYIYCEVAKGNTVDTTIYPMLNYGTTALPYRPYSGQMEIESAVLGDILLPWTPYSKQSHISLVGDGLKGIPVTDASLATYTDEKGQMWCADYVDCERGVLVQRVYIADMTNCNILTDLATTNVYYLKTGIKAIGGHSGYNHSYCTHLQRSAYGYNTYDNEHYYVNNDGDIEVYINKDVEVNVSTLKVAFVLATPIETPLSADEIASYKALHSNYKVTSVMNDCDAFMEVQYNADTKLYIDNKFTELAEKLLA